MNYLTNKTNSVFRYILWHYLSKKLDLIHVAEYPKSGGTWLTQLVSTYTGIVTRRNELAKYERAIMHGHYMYDNSFNKTLSIVRDGRDIAVSYYFHMIVGNNKIDFKKTLANRKKLKINDPENIKENLPQFIQYLNTEYTKGFNKFSWSEFIDSYLDKDNVCLIRYEKMLEDTKAEMYKALNYLGYDIDESKLEETIQKFTFKKQTQRKPGEENKNSFLRKGIAGDWKNHFTKESAEMFDMYSGKTLISLGYENDNSWVKKFK